MRTVFPGKDRVAISAAGAISDSTQYPRKSLELIGILTRDLEECGVSRAQVAWVMTAELGYPVTVAQIEAMVSRTHANRMPAEWLPAWAKATSSKRVLDLLCAKVGLSLATAEDKQFAELGRHQLAEQKLAKQLWEKI